MDVLSKYLPAPWKSTRTQIHIQTQTHTTRRQHIWPSSLFQSDGRDRGGTQFRLYFIQIEYKSMCKEPAPQWQIISICAKQRARWRRMGFLLVCRLNRQRHGAIVNYCCQRFELFGSSFRHICQCQQLASLVPRMSIRNFVAGVSLLLVHGFGNANPNGNIQHDSMCQWINNHKWHIWWISLGLDGDTNENQSISNCLHCLFACAWMHCTLCYLFQTKISFALHPKFNWHFNLTMYFEYIIGASEIPIKNRIKTLKKIHLRIGTWNEFLVLWRRPSFRLTFSFLVTLMNHAQSKHTHNT